MRQPGEGLRVVYMDRGPRLPEFLWWDGDVAPDDSFQARQSVHRLFSDIVAAARQDRTFNGGRYVRNDRWLLVETRLDGRDDVGRPLAATLVVYLSSGPDRLAGAADQAIGVLREQKLPLPVRSLPQVLDQAEWKSRSLLGRLIGRLLRQAPGRGPSRSAGAGGMLRERNAMGQTPELNQRLVVLDRDDYIEARRTKPDLLADQLTTVIPVPLQPPWTELEPLRLLDRDLKPGAIFVRNRFDQDRYVEAGGAYETIALSKFNEFARICQLLGAHSLEVEELREFSEAGEQTGRIDLKAGPVGGGASGGSKQFKRVAQTVVASWTWETGEPDQEQAEQVAEQSGLRSDAMISGLLQQRGHLTNRLTRHDLLLDISSEAQNEISLALELEPYLSTGFIRTKFTGKFDQLRGQSQTLQLKVSVLFTKE
jgi:hypothetical protein